MKASNFTRTNTGINAIVSGFGALALVCACPSLAQTAPGGATAASAEPAPAHFTAKTAAINPRDVTLRIDLLKWSDETARAEVVAALASDSDAPKALASLPSVGHLWQSGSGVGYSVKYAFRSSTAQGERLTFVTDKRLGAYDFKPWSAAAAEPKALGYSVIELYLGADGRGDGTLSLVAGVEIDSASSVISLAAGAPRVLASAGLVTKQY